MIWFDLGNGFQVVAIGKGQYMVQSVAVELSMDHTAVLQQASNSGQAFVSVSGLREELGWEENRAKRALDHMVKEGLAWIDTQAPDECLYYFPSMFSACVEA